MSKPYPFPTDDEIYDVVHEAVRPIEGEDADNDDVYGVAMEIKEFIVKCVENALKK
jgi:hypothetical protein